MFQQKTEMENIFKSSLALLILRRRVQERKHREENMTSEIGCNLHSRKRKNLDPKVYNAGTDNAEKSLDLLSQQSLKDNSYLLLNKDDTNSRGQGHLASMFTIALSTAHSIYQPYMRQFLKASQPNANPCSSPIYDSRAASLSLSDMTEYIKRKGKAAAKNSSEMKVMSSPVQSYAVLDGIVSHVVTNLHTLLTKFDSQMLLGQLNEVEMPDKERFQESLSSDQTHVGRGNSKLTEPICRQHNIIYDVFLHGIIESVGGFSKSETEPNTMHYHNCVQKILSTCTICHRIVFLSCHRAKSFHSHEEIESSKNLIKCFLQGIVRVLHLNYDALSKSDQRSFRSKNIHVQEVIAVNFLLLLEEVTSMYFHTFSCQEYDSVQVESISSSSHENHQRVSDDNNNSMRKEECSSSSSGDIVCFLANQFDMSGKGARDENLMLPLSTRETISHFIEGIVNSDNKLEHEILFDCKLIGSKTMHKLVILSLMQRLASNHISKVAGF